MFGFAMGFVGLFLAGISLIFPNKLHVTVYPDHVSMASTYSQTGGNEVIIPYSGLSKVEIKDELNIVGKLKPYIVFTQKSGALIKQEAGNNERMAFTAIQQALAEYQTKNPASATSSNTIAQTPATPEASSPYQPRIPTTPNPGSNRPPATSTPAFKPPASTPPTLSPPSLPSQTGDSPYRLKRYPIDIALPPNYNLVTADAVVADGTKLLACYANSWSPVTAVTSNGDGTITCSWDDYPGFTYRMVREDLIISSNPTSTQPNAGQSNPSRPNAVSGSKYTLKRYPINIAVPRGKSVLKADSEITVGMKLGACYAGHWESVTVVEINDDGTISCNWDNWKSFTYKMVRDDLIADAE